MEERELPAGWEATCLADVSQKIVDGSHNPPKPTEAGMPMLSARNITARRIEFDVEHRLISSADFEAEHRRTEVADGDVLLTIVGAIGRTAVVPDGSPPFALQRSVAVIKPACCIGSDFLSYALESPETQAFLLDNAKGTAQKGIYLKQLQQLPLRIAPLNEQRRIASKLDTTLAAVDSCRQRLEGVAALIKRFRQAVLEAATSGELTREWRNGKEMTTQEATIQELCKGQKNSLCIGPFGSNLKVSDYADAGVPLIFVREVRARSFGGSGTKFVSHQKAVELAAHVASPGDLLMTKMGDPPGDTAVYPDHMPHAIITSDVVCMRPDPSKTCKFFLSYLLESPGGRDRIEEITAGVAQQKISLERFRKMTLSVPPLEEQHEIVRRAQQLFSLADQLEAKLTAARQVVERLTPALLAKAFRGELVPQDPSDEPASVLLERIRAARQAEAAAGKPSRRGRRKAAASPAQGLFDAAPVPIDCLSQLLRECGALSGKALLAASDLEPLRFDTQLELELQAGRIRQLWEDGQELWEAVG